ncbi:hypothetical protein [Enterococcus mundtii]|uniref:hypothetical protein n=1 Tax=Enterococcus TaxID=1350 RepID=UPI001377F522|nr:hypothetical protein [Enterococcus mundtii]NBA62679.1 hypothetical protein [Enterococcus mundtii]
MNSKEFESRKEVSKEIEATLLKTMKQKHLKQLPVMQYIHDTKISGKEKACLLGSMKNFEQLRRTYVKTSSSCQLLLEIS